MKNILHVMYVWWATIVGGFLNYLYHPLILQFLTLEEFAEFWSLVWIFNILGVLISWVILFLVKELSTYSDNLPRVKWILKYTIQGSFWVSLFMYVIFLLISPLIADFLHFHHIWPIALAWTTILISFVSAPTSAVLQWMKFFKHISAVNILTPLLKLIFWVVFLYLWRHIYWAIWWFLAASLLSFIYCRFVLYKYLFTTKTNLKYQDVIHDFRRDYKTVLHFFFLVLILSFFMNADLLFAKHFFDNEVAWLYAGLSILAKFLFFLTWAIETVYYPQMTNYSIDKVPRHHMINIVVMISLLTVAGIIVGYFIWPFVLEIIKQWFWSNNTLFLLALFFAWTLWLLNILSKVLIAWKIYLVNYILLFALILLVVVLYMTWAQTIYSMTYTFISFTFLLNIVLLWIYVIYRKKYSQI